VTVNDQPVSYSIRIDWMSLVSVSLVILVRLKDALGRCI
jgi:hypothetical protein